ncbi:MAG: TIGR03560 family F420-dependent LLM class oxidoreductase [Dehalococcoidia bacterium]|nr:TIGR03560 family F420-dependent LLM class oxidoreductase [Dehalococcoidia bacterium]
MKFGLHIGQQNITIDECRRMWRWADTAGFDWVDVWDHFYEAPPVDGNGSCFEATTCMAAIACETASCRIGVLVLGMNYRHPAVLANALVTIDHLSGGRLEIGLGAGWHEPEYRAYGIPFRPIKERMDMLEEGVQVVRLLTTQDRSDFEGQYYRLENAACNPKPVQARPRIWVGGRGEKRTLRIAARHADGWNVPYVSPDEYRRLSGVLDEWCEKEGRDPAEIERNVNLSFHMAASPAAAHVDWAERHFVETWGPAAEPMRSAGVVIGTPDQAIELVGRYKEAGAARVNIAIRPPVDWDALQAWTGEVIQAFA